MEENCDKLQLTATSVISHLKQDHRMNQSRFKGIAGHRINASLTAVSWKLRK